MIAARRLSLLAVVAVVSSCASLATSPVLGQSTGGPPYSVTDVRGCRCGADSASFVDAPGHHEILIEDTLVEYYLPQSWRPGETPEILALIHGAGFCHIDGALDYIPQWRHWADRHNVILVAPAFDRRYSPHNPLDRYPFRGFNPSQPRYAEAPCACEFQAQCEQFEYYRRLQFFPYGYHVPREYMWSFIFLVVPNSGLRTDLLLNNILRAFHAHYAIPEERFSIWGYSGGGQFIARYMMVHPERLKRVALGGSGSFLYPNHEKRYPYGMVGNVGNTPFSAAEWDAKLARMLHLPVLIFAGGADFVGAGEHPESAWQGNGQLEIAERFLQALHDADRRLKGLNMRPADAPFRCELFPLYGRDHGGAARDAVAWLQEHWWGAPINPAGAGI